MFQAVAVGVGSRSAVQSALSSLEQGFDLAALSYRASSTRRIQACSLSLRLLRRSPARMENAVVPLRAAGMGLGRAAAERVE